MKKRTVPTAEHYAAAFAPRDPSELAEAAARAAGRLARAALQKSIYGRLRGEFGDSRAGTVAWMLIHAVDEGHRAHGAAREAMGRLDRFQLGMLLDAAEGAVKAAKTPDVAAIARRILDMVSLALREWVNNCPDSDVVPQ